MSTKEAVAAINKVRAKTGQGPIHTTGWFFTLYLALGFMAV